jgi:hypothetical protein
VWSSFERDDDDDDDAKGVLEDVLLVDMYGGFDVNFFTRLCARGDGATAGATAFGATG